MLEIKCLQNKKNTQYIANLLDDLKKKKKKKKIIDETSSSSSASDTEENFENSREDTGEIHPLYSNDEMSSGEEDEDLLPDNYRFYSARI